MVLIQVTPHHSGPRSVASLVGVLALATLALGTATPSFSRASDFLSPIEASQLKLEEAWRRNLRLPAGAQSIVEIRLMVHATDPDKYVEVIGEVPTPAKVPAAENADPSVSSAADTPTAEATVYARLLIDESGLAAGIPDRAEAERLARNEIRRLKRRGITAEVRATEIPKIRLYVLSDDGTIQCRDAETGDPVWLQRVGNRVRGYTGIGVDDEHVTVLNGAEMVVLDRFNGNIYQTIPILHVPLQGATHCGGYSLIPTVGPRVLGYPLSSLETEPFVEQVSGECLAHPTAAIGSSKIAWGTASSFVYVMELSGEPNMQFRLATDGVVSEPPAAASGERFFFGSEMGQIYGIRATRSGEVLWNRPTGQPIYKTPVVAGEQVMFVTAYGNLICVSADDGYSTWDDQIPGVANILGVLNDEVIVRKLSGALEALSAQTGESLFQFRHLHPREAFVNRQTDRLYLVDPQGTVQCLRPEGKLFATLYVPLVPNAATADQVADDQTSKPSVPPPAPAAMDDPFGAGAGGDPFGGGQMKDPFAPAAGDPFAPAPGGDDPFGGNPF